MPQISSQHFSQTRLVIFFITYGFLSILCSVPVPARIYVLTFLIRILPQHPCQMKRIQSGVKTNKTTFPQISNNAKDQDNNDYCSRRVHRNYQREALFKQRPEDEGRMTDLDPRICA